MRALPSAVRAIGRPRGCCVSVAAPALRSTCSSPVGWCQWFPETEPQIVRRVYRLDRAGVLERYRKQVAQTVPEYGVVGGRPQISDDSLAGRRITIDATFPGPRWDGRSPLPVACWPGQDHPAIEDPDAEKRELECEHCDPAVSRSSRHSSWHAWADPHERAGAGHLRLRRCARRQ